jgi:hypothetical protein
MKVSQKMAIIQAKATARHFPLLATAILSVTGCAVGPKYKTPSVAVPPAYQETGRPRSPATTIWVEAGGRSSMIRSSTLWNSRLMSPTKI